MKKTIMRLIAVVMASVGMIMEMGANTVPVHDPSVVVVYKDAEGNSYPEQSANRDRTKYYYLMGTQLGAAYSLDLLNWTEFTPTFVVNGQISTDYLSIFKENMTWSGWKDNARAKENLWAADIIWNKEMKKWCMYYSVNGDDWLSSICMLSSDKIEGPYEWKGTVVFGGMDGQTSGAGNNDYKRVTGESSIPARYMSSKGGWGGTYGSSCIDPNVIYDEEGRLWIVYGSWSGGIFVLKLDEKTGLRDYNWNYGYTLGADGANWAGSRLRFDPYMGVHIAGGYYVSGEGPYMKYIKDADGKGYYYLFMSYGFYSPEGGYVMRVFRSDSVTGVFKDATGDDAVFHKYILNYWNNITYGVGLMENYSWDWWGAGKGQTAQGHNSVLVDEDGTAYVIYHTKDNTGNGYGWHHVEVHPLVFGKDGWPLAAPFERREGEKIDKSKEYRIEDIAGEYSALLHSSLTEEQHKAWVCNRTQKMRLNADKTISGAYTGTWKYEYAEGKQFITLETNVGTLNGAILEQRIEDRSEKTFAITALSPTTERCFWAFRETQTAYGEETAYSPSLRIGDKDKSMQWDEVEKFLSADAPAGDFEARFKFHNHNKGVNNWDNWAVWMDAGSENVWKLRADAYSIESFKESTVNYGYEWKWEDGWNAFDDKDIEVTIRRQGTTVDVFAAVDGKSIYGATSYGSPTGAMKIYLGGESTYLEVSEKSVASLKSREVIGTNNEDGTYSAAFKAYSGAETKQTGDFDVRYQFYNYHSNNEENNWNNFIIKNTIGKSVGLIRADRYQMDCAGEVEFETSWGENWSKFVKMTENALVTIDIKRKGGTIVYDVDFKGHNGVNGTMKVTQKGITEDEVTLAITGEKNVSDILSVMQRRTEIVEGQDEAVTLTKHGAGSATQKVDAKADIEAFYYEWTGEPDSIKVVGLPKGIEYSIDKTAKRIDISGKAEDAFGEYEGKVELYSADSIVKAEIAITIADLAGIEQTMANGGAECVYNAETQMLTVRVERECVIRLHSANGETVVRAKGKNVVIDMSGMGKGVYVCVVGEKVWKVVRR